MGTGALVIVLYATQASALSETASIVSVGATIAGASLLLGGLLGFLFGVPRAVQRDATANGNDAAGPEDAGTYQANTNLEQVSDWLTKILIGVGLAQIMVIPEKLLRLSRFMAAGLGDFSSSPAFALAIVMYFCVCGFLLGYLWTRLHLAGALERAERLSLMMRAESAVYLALASDQKSGAPERGAVSLTDVVSETVPSRMLRQLPQASILWVDDKPANNLYERRSLEALGIRFTTSTSTEDALEKIKRHRYDVIISDMKRPPDMKAGYTLLCSLQEHHIDISFVIYTGSSRPEHKAEARKRGAAGSTDQPPELFELVIGALQKRQR